MKTIKKILKIIGLGLMGIILLAAIASCGADDAEEEPVEQPAIEEEQEQEEPEEVEEPEEEQEEPEEEQEEPEEEAEEPEEEEDNSITPSEQEYVDYTRQHNEKMAELMGNFSEVFSNPTRTAEWQQEAAIAISGIKVRAEEYLEKAPEPSERQQKVHEPYRAAMEKYHEAMSIIPGAIDNNSAEGIEIATSKIKEGTGLINEATEGLKEFIEEIN